MVINDYSDILLLWFAKDSLNRNKRVNRYNIIACKSAYKMELSVLKNCYE